jgi:hypothetical protein
MSNLYSRTHLAICNPQSTKRTAFTGTPIQNRYLDVQAMLAFMRITPWSSLSTFKNVGLFSTVKVPLLTSDKVHSGKEDHDQR